MKTLHVNALSKQFGKRQILRDISISIEQGEIIGFVGPNGAGKTTTMKVITSLIRPDSGSVSVCGYDLQRQREQALSCLSAIVEGPSLYGYLSGRENLEFIARLRGASAEKVKEIIAFTGLEGRLDDKVKRYSMGMKQRLALGISLLSSPKLLILDEPTNGLDPTGIIELREQLLKMAKQDGISIFISSHNLAEIEKICDRFLFIKEGVIVSERDNSKAANVMTYSMQIKDEQAMLELLKDCNYVLHYEIDGTELIIAMENDRLSDLLQQIALRGIEYDAFQVVVSDIEQRYSQIYAAR